MAKAHRKTDARTAQGTLLEDPSFLKEIVQRVLQELLEAEMTEHIGAAPYERGEGRTGHRNGYKPRTLRTRVDTLNLLVPQDREGTFSTRLFARYQGNEKALCLALMESAYRRFPREEIQYPVQKELREAKMGQMGDARPLPPRYTSPLLTWCAVSFAVAKREELKETTKDEETRMPLRFARRNQGRSRPMNANFLSTGAMTLAMTSPHCALQVVRRLCLAEPGPRVVSS